jgi:hypothetical protein
MTSVVADLYRGSEGLKYLASLNGSVIRLEAAALEPSNSIDGLSAALLTFSEIQSHACVVAVAVIRNNNLSEDNCELLAPVRTLLGLSRGNYGRSLYTVSVRGNTTSLYS